MYTKPLRKTLFCLIAGVLTAASVSAQRTIYVSPDGDQGNDGLSRLTPAPTITRGSALARPGDTVIVMPGTYARETPTVDWDEVGIARSGRPGEYITIRGERDAAGRRPLIVSTQLQALSCFEKSYLIIEGLELTIGEEDDQGLVAAFGTPQYQQFWGYSAEEAWNGRVGIALNNAHHIIARDLYIHDFPGNGVQSGGADAILIEDVTVEHCGYGAPNANSGISFYQPRDRGQGNVDDYPDYGIVIRGCETRYNTNLRNFVDWSDDNLTDGNGIILDDFRRSQSTNPVNYPKRTLVLQNVSYGNGGPGINVFESDRIDIYHNSTFDNGISASLANQAYNIVATPREMQLFALADVNVVNNILYSTDDERRFYSGDDRNQERLTFRNNLLYSSERDGSELTVPDGNLVGAPGYFSAQPLGRVLRERLARTTRPYDNASVQARLREPTANAGFPIQDLRIPETSPAAGAAEDLGYGSDIGALPVDGSVGVRDAPVTHDLGARLRYDGEAIAIAEVPAGARVFAYDALGRPVHASEAKGAQAVRFDVRDYPTGVFNVEVRYGGERWVGRVSVVR